MADAAQEFLNKQLSKNKFTIQQQSNLDASGGASVAGYGDGIVPGGDAYAKYGKMPDTDSSTGTSNSSSTSSAGGGGKYRGFDPESDSGRNYSSGAWGKGELDAAGLAAKYKLDTSQEGRGEGHIWGRNADGSEVYIGKSNMSMASNKDLIANHSKQAGDEVDHSGVPENLSSSGDIKGAILTEWNGGEALNTGEEEKERTPIEHSPEVKQAAARVRAYEDNIMSGKTSQNIFGDYYGQTGLELNDASSNKTNDQAEVATNYGETGVGTSTDAKPAAETATYSFLDSKKTDLKNKMNFTPAK